MHVFQQGNLSADGIGKGKARLMKILKLLIYFIVFTGTSCMSHLALAAERWREDAFPPPNGGKLVFTITNGGNPACASYDGANCLWGKSASEIDFSKIRPLVCGADHRKLYGVTGFEDQNHWCNLSLRHSNAKVTPLTPPQAAGGYRTTEWSGWGRAEGVEYRYRIGWDPATGGPGKTVDAIYELRNSGARQWSGAARSGNCAQNTLWGSADVAIAPGQTREARVRAPNCGNAKNPEIRPNVVRAGKFD
jgi:hypothetical protein